MTKNDVYTGKVKLSLCFNWAPRHEDILGEWRYSSTHSLTSALDGGEWSISRPSRFTPRERVRGTHWIGWVRPRTVLDAVVKKIPSPGRESNPRTPIVQSVSQRYTDWAITALDVYTEHVYYIVFRILQYMIASVTFTSGQMDVALLKVSDWNSRNLCDIRWHILHNGRPVYTDIHTYRQHLFRNPV
jgi:hypothetical protein